MGDGYDVIVVGLGAMGSAALRELAGRGVRVLGIERFSVPHDRGSYHGRTRIIRRAYHEDPSYVTLLERAYPLWRELEDEAGERLLHITGSLDAGVEGGPFVVGSIESCRLHGLEHEVLTAAEIAARFPAFHLPDDFAGVLQPDGGYLLAERSVVAMVDSARRRGATVLTGEAVLAWSVAAGGHGVEVRTASGSHAAAALVLTAGAWAATLCPSLRALTRPERQVVGWFRPLRPELFAAERFPVFDILFAEGNYYGLPRRASLASSSAVTATCTRESTPIPSIASCIPRTKPCCVARCAATSRLPTATPSSSPPASSPTAPTITS